MSYLKTIAREQNATVVNNAIVIKNFLQPKQGWIKTVRLALGMKGITLSKKLEGHRSIATYLERSELEGSITINKLKQTAEVMGCELVYAIVPKTASIDNLLNKQAQYKAQDIVNRASEQMRLEGQSLDKVSLQKEIERLAKNYLDEMPADFWEA
jgi:predicted DNA-binding mobile mystery protein A